VRPWQNALFESLNLGVFLRSRSAVCGKTFEATLGALMSAKDAEANLQQQFYGHKFKRKDSPQTAGRILKDNR
jgi:hypothetical protein